MKHQAASPFPEQAFFLFASQDTSFTQSIPNGFIHPQPSKMTKAARVEQPSLMLLVLNFMRLAQVAVLHPAVLAWKLNSWQSERADC